MDGDWFGLHVFRVKSDAGQSAWGEWMCVGIPVTSSNQTIKPPWR